MTTLAPYLCRMLDDEPTFTPIEQLAEFGLIDLLTKPFEQNPDRVIHGPGDDCAVLPLNETHYQLITSDILAQGIHFDLTYAPLQHVGYKALAVNLSDIYAMGGTPTGFTVSLAVDARISVEALQVLYSGILACAKAFDVQLLGGDTSASHGGMFISITALGHVAKDKLTLRSGAKPGNLVVVSGDVGAAYAGLQVMEREKRVYHENPNVQPELEQYAYCVGRQLRPTPMKAVWDILNERGIHPRSMIDVSDGLASECHHIARASQVGIRLYHDKLPIDPQTLLIAEEFNIAALNMALFGGEDYELLFTIESADFNKLKDVQGLTVIGHVVGEHEGVQLVQADGSQIDLPASGFNHFTSQETAH